MNTKSKHSFTSSIVQSDPLKSKTETHIKSYERKRKKDLHIVSSYDNLNINIHMRIFFARKG